MVLALGQPAVKWRLRFCLPSYLYQRFFFGDLRLQTLEKKKKPNSHCGYTRPHRQLKQSMSVYTPKSLNWLLKKPIFYGGPNLCVIQWWLVVVDRRETKYPQTKLSILDLSWANIAQKILIVGKYLLGISS
jgi:hypothetical protein